MASTVETYLGSYSNCFAVVGVLASTCIALKILRTILRFIRDYGLGPTLGLSANLKSAGSWAVVTGCTDGIGKAYAEQLARKGLNIALISRTKSKLDDLAKELESRFKIQTRVIAVDFTQTDIYGKIEAALTGLEIGTLVNNVGMSYSFPQYFMELEDTSKLLTDMLNCNMLSMCMMTNIVLPGMVERHCGYIVNIASAAAEAPTPLLTVYSASKVFMDYFTKGLQIEYPNTGVTFQVVRPNFVATKLSGIRRSNMFTPYPNEFVKSALGTIGITNSTSGFWSHSIMSGAMKWIPKSIILKSMLNARKSALRKIEKKKAQN